MRHLFGTFLCLIAAGSLLGCGGRSTPSPLIVGHVANLTGGDSDIGDQAACGIRLAVKEFDRDGARSLGRPIAVLHTDARGRLEAFEAEAVRLVAINRAVALLGGTTAKEVERLDRDRVPLLTPTGLHRRGMSDLVYCTGLAPSFQGRVLAGFASRHLQKAGPVSIAACTLGFGSPLGAAVALALAHDTPAIVVVQDERHEEFAQVAESFVRELAPEGAQPRGILPRPVVLRYGKDAGYEKLAQEIKAHRPAVLLVAGAAAAVRQLGGHLPQDLVLLFGGSELEVKTLRTPPWPPQALYAVVSFVTDNPKAEEFVRQYRTAFSEEPDSSAALAYEGAGLLFEVLRQADGVWTRTQLRQQFAAISCKGLFGPLSFEGQVIRRPAFLVRLENERASTVEKAVP